MLPTKLRRALQSIPHPTAVGLVINSAPSIIIKAKEADTRTMGRRGVIIKVVPQLGPYPTAAVFRIYIEFRDQAKSYMSLDTYLNPNAESDLEMLRLLTTSPTLDFYIFDMALNPVSAKRINWNEKIRANIAVMLQEAHRHNAQCFRENKYDYVAALTEMQEDFLI